MVRKQTSLLGTKFRSEVLDQDLLPPFIRMLAGLNEGPGSESSKEMGLKPCSLTIKNKRVDL